MISHTDNAEDRGDDDTDGLGYGEKRLEKSKMRLHSKVAGEFLSKLHSLSRTLRAKECEHAT
jgi:hypothetical protein